MIIGEVHWSYNYQTLGWFEKETINTQQLTTLYQKCIDTKDLYSPSSVLLAQLRWNDSSDYCFEIMKQNYKGNLTRFCHDFLLFFFRNWLYFCVYVDSPVQDLIYNWCKLVLVHSCQTVSIKQQQAECYSHPAPASHLSVTQTASAQSIQYITVQQNNICDYCDK